MAAEFVAAVVLLWPAGAFAYIDPGSGLLLVQGLISAVIGGIFIARRAILSLLHKASVALGMRTEPPKPAEPPDASSR